MTPHESERLDGAMEYLEKNGFHEPVKVVARLRASNAALKAENEALKDRVRVQNLQGINPFKITMREYDALQAKLSLYTSWQPSDPGTKEAMECAGSSWEYRAADIAKIAVSLGVLAKSYRAAMARLEEAEKKGKENAEYWMNRAHERCQDHIVRAESAEASLASVTKERDDFERKGIELCQVFGNLLMDEQREPRAVLVASLAELRKRMGEAEKVVEAARETVGADMRREVAMGVYILRLEQKIVDYDALASLPKPKEERK